MKIYIADKKLIKIFPEKFPKNTIAVDAGEKNKNIFTVLKLLKEIKKLKADRRTVLVGVGGGSVLDIVGFCASIYLRGLKWIAVPSTLLAMVDACVGGKTGVNFDGIKNQIGTFYNPSKVEIDMDFIKSLPEKDFKDGMAEMIKHGLIADREFLFFLKNNSEEILKKNGKILKKIIKKSQNIKTEITKGDFREEHNRKILNYGHSFGHAIESASNFKISHGEAISIGMDWINRWQIYKKNNSKKMIEIQNEVRKVLTIFNLNYSIRQKILQKIIKQKLLYTDKKVQGDKIDIVVLNKIGEAQILKVKIDSLLADLLKLI